MSDKGLPRPTGCNHEGTRSRRTKLVDDSTNGLKLILSWDKISDGIDLLIHGVAQDFGCRLFARRPHDLRPMLPQNLSYSSVFCAVGGLLLFALLLVLLCPSGR